MKRLAAGLLGPLVIACAPAAMAAQQVVGLLTTPGATFTTPAGTTAYASGDLIANSATAGSVVPMPVSITRDTAQSDAWVSLRRARVKTTDTGFAGQTVRVHVYKTLPTVTNGDNGVFLSTESDEVCTLDVALSHHFSDYEKGFGTPNEGSECNFYPATGTSTVWLLLEARSAATPVGAKPWTVVLEDWAN